MMRKYIDLFSRFFVGGLFIFSGLIKLNDPIGTEIKLEEYFEVFSTDFGSFFHVFIPFALPIGMVLIVLEIVLGVALLINYRMKLTTLVLLILIIFFTFLTGYSAILNKVTDCGCFGDAIKLTPWESFYKDLILIVFILHLFWYRKKYDPLLRTVQGHAVILGVTLISFFLGIYAVRHLPFIDFRAYKIGNNIPEQMTLPPDAVRDSVVMTFIYEKAGKHLELTMDQLSTVDSTYTFIDRRDKVIREGDMPKIIDYRVESVDGEDYTQQTFVGTKLILVVYNVKNASDKNADRVSKLINDLEGKAEAIILTSSPAADVEAWRHEHQWAAPYFFADATVLKTILRSNPGLTLWVNGTVKGMWHYNDIPEASEILKLM
ncbi:MAG: DoxX family membrane protein [Cyclobacteriaceae bacterium]|nr:DoxX family membrane protein [Cyclobacteriaceae bacterium]